MILSFPGRTFSGEELWAFLFYASPAYALIGAPVLGMLLRWRVLRQREFLADADAVLLTRDPEGLGLALAKVGAATGSRSRTDPATAHLYFANPLPPDTPWWDTIFPSHPPVGDRIALVAKMGNGIDPAKLRVAEEIGAERGYRLRLTDPPDASRAGQSEPIDESPDLEPALTAQPAVSTDLKDVGGAFSTRTVPGTAFRLTDPFTPLYERADGWSPVLEQLSEGAVVTFRGIEGKFAHVGAKRTAGYISRSAAAAEAAPST